MTATNGVLWAARNRSGEWAQIHADREHGGLRLSLPGGAYVTSGHLGRLIQTARAVYGYDTDEQRATEGGSK